MNETQTTHKCPACLHQLIRAEVDNEGETVVGYTCRSHSYDPFGLYKQCNFWLVVYGGGRKELRERKQRAKPWVSK